MTNEEAIKHLKSQLIGNKVIKLDEYDLQRLLDDVVDRAYELGARPKEREFPQAGDYYWLINVRGGVGRSKWYGEQEDDNRLRQGNVFPSQEAAQREARRREVRARIAAIDAEYEPTDPKYIYKHSDGKFYFSSAPEFIGAIRVKSLLAAERVLAEIPHDDLDLLCADPEFAVPKEG